MIVLLVCQYLFRISIHITNMNNLFFIYKILTNLSSSIFIYLIGKEAVDWFVNNVPKYATSRQVAVKLGQGNTPTTTSLLIHSLSSPPSLLFSLFLFFFTLFLCFFFLYYMQN